MAKSKVAVLKVNPATILDDIDRLTQLADMKLALVPSTAAILTHIISRRYPFPAADTTPWQLEGAVLALQNAGLRDSSCVQNKTVVTNVFKGEDLNNYV